MTLNHDNLLNSIMESLSRIDYIKPGEIPNIELYMDQVTTFMEENLKASKRSSEDKILTKTMINNYAKNHLLPPPVKKKYSKEHILLLIFIYHFKNILSIHDIQNLLHPITEKYFNANSEISLEQIYDEVFSLEKDQVERLKKDVTEKFEQAENTFADAPEEDKEFLHLFSFICMLSFDVFVKKQLIEKMLDLSLQSESDKGK